jgi:hypothetical protein
MLGLEGRPIFPEATKFCSCVAENVESLTAGTVDGALEAGARFIAEGIDRKHLRHLRLDEGAAAQTPGGTGDRHDKSLFEGADGPEIGAKGGTNAFVFFVLAGADKIAQGKQTVGYGVLRRGLPALFCTGTGREKCVLAVGQRLRLGCHQGYPSAPTVQQELSKRRGRACKPMTSRHK